MPDSAAPIALAVTGASGSVIDLNSTTPGTQWGLALTPGAAQSVSYVDVQDSDAGGGEPRKPRKGRGGAQRVQGHLALTVPFAASDIGAVQSS